MNYDMGEPSELPQVRCHCQKLTPSVDLFRWKGPDGGWKVGRAFTCIMGSRYLMQDVDGLYMVESHALEVHPSRDVWEPDDQ